MVAGWHCTVIIVMVCTPQLYIRSVSSLFTPIGGVVVFTVSYNLEAPHAGQTVITVPYRCGIVLYYNCTQFGVLIAVFSGLGVISICHRRYGSRLL